MPSSARGSGVTAVSVFFRSLCRRTRRGDVGIAPYAGNVRCFSVGADAFIGPEADGTGVSVFSTAPETYPAGLDSTAGKQKLTNFRYADRIGSVL